MKKQFQSKSVPRGARTIWRYLGALFLILTLSIGQMWGEEVTWEGPIGSFVSKKLSDNTTEVTVTKDAGSSSKTISCVSSSGQSYLSLNGGGKNLKFAVPNGYSITNIKLIWMSGADAQALPILFGEAISAVGTVESKSNAVTITNGGFKMTSAIATSGATNCESEDNIAIPAGMKEVMIGRSGAYKAVDYATIGSVQTTLKFRLNGNSGYFDTNVGTGSTPFIGRVILTIASSTVAPTISAPTANQSATYTVGDVITPLSVTATGSPTPTYQWYSNASASTTGATLITGAESASYTPSSAAESDLYFYCVATNSEGSAQSPYFHVKVNAAVATAPSFTSPASEPAAAEYHVGDAISALEVVAAGYPAPTLKWYSNDSKSTEGATLITGAENASYTPSSAAVSDLYFYCVATNTEGTAQSEYFHVIVAPVSYCAELNPATSGEEPVLGTIIDMQTGSYGGTIKVVGRKQAGSFAYTANGLTFNKGGVDSVRVTLNHLIQAGTKFYVTVNNQDGSKDQGFYLQNLSKTKKADMHRQTGSTGDTTYVYTAVAGDGLVGVNAFIIARGSSSAALKSLKVSNCGAELLELSSAVNPAHDPAYATVTLSKTLIAAGGTATATYSAIDAAYDFDEWQISGTGASLSDAKANPVTITMGSTDAVVTLKLKAASVKHTVTYYDGAEDPANKLGEELVVEGSNPAAAEIVVPHKLGYTFAGWSTTNGGAVVPLNTISVAADMPLFAVFNAVNCSAQSGTIFSVILNKPQAENCTIRSGSGYETEADLIKYGTVSGGIALAKNSSTSNHIVITTDPKLRLLGGNGKVHIQFDCALQEGDKIRTTIENQNIAYTTSDSRSTTNFFEKGTAKELTITKDHVLENASEIYLWAGSSNDGKLISLEVIRPEKFEVTFNMHDHGDAVDPQYVIDGGKVEEPATASITGWDFGGWYKTYVADPESYSNPWDFDNDVVEAATELHAKWTEHVLSNNVALGTLTVNGEDVAIVPSQLVYAVELPFGTTAIPTVAATAADANAKACNVTQALAVDGSATIYVKAEDNSTEATYTINFSVATSKDIQLVFKTGTTPCVGSASTATQILSNNAAVSTYINQITFTNVEGAGDDGAEGSSLNVGKKAGNMFTLSAKAGYALQSMNFLAKIQDATCEYSINGGAWTELASTNTGGDECYAPFSAAEVHEFRLRSTGTSGVWIRNMQLTIVEACTPIVVAWDEEPVEFEVGKSGYAIAATANNGGTITYASADNTVIDANASTGALTIAGLGSVALSASTPEGDGSTYCANGGDPIVLSKTVKTYYLVKFDGQNGEATDEIKYFSGDAAIALPAAPSYPGYDFQGWFDAETGGNQYTAAITPTASTTVYAQWVAQCAGATITTQPTGASYLTGRTPVALVCEATAGNGGALTYEWFTCDDQLKTNPVAATATPSTAVAGTFYYFCKVTEEGCAVEAFSDVVTITVADKDAICIIKSTPTSGTDADVDGVFQGNAYFNGRASDKKLNSKYNYVAVELADGYTFQAGDKVVLNQTAEIGASDITKFYVFADVPADGKSYVTVLNTSPVQGDNWFAMPAELVGQSSLYIGRVDASCNPTVGYLAVYRACAPILNKVTVNGAEGKPNALNQVVFEVAASTSQSQLEAIAFDWISNNDAWTADPANAPVAANAWEFGVANEVTFTDKDGDQSVYTITVNKAVPSSDATLSTLSYGTPATAIALADGVFEYNVELPYGTSAVPALAATAHHAGASVTNIADAAAFINRHATSTVTVTAEDGTTTQDYTVNFTVSRYESKLIWDGATMTSFDDAVAAATAAGVSIVNVGDQSVQSKSSSFEDKNYTKCIQYGGATSASRNFGITIPAGKVAKMSIVYRPRSAGERSIIIGTDVAGAINESAIVYATTTHDHLDRLTADIFAGGTIYINTTNGYQVFEISLQLADGYARSAMLGVGVYGTVCVPNNVAVEDVQGVTVYELMGREPEYGKLAFDEIVSGELEAGVPYVFQAHRNHMALLYGETHVANPVDKGNGMYGTFVDQTLTELNDIYYFAQRALWSCSDLTSLSLPANRAYVKLSEVDYLSNPNPAPGRRRVTMAVNGEKIATGCENLNVSDRPVKMIIDGQMYILRGEKMYDAKGQLVK